MNQIGSEGQYIPVRDRNNQNKIIKTITYIILVKMKVVQNILHKISAAKFSLHKCQICLYPLTVSAGAEIEENKYMYDLNFINTRVISIAIRYLFFS